MKFLVGICQIQLKNLDFDTYHSRGKNKTAVAYLGSVLVDSCKSHLWSHQIPVRVTPDQLHEILALSQVSLEDLNQDLPRLLAHSLDSLAESTDFNYRKLQTRRKVECIHGKQRYEAAIESLGEEEWWTVRIYCLPEGSDPYRLLPHETNQDYQTPYSDGDIYRKAYMSLDDTIILRLSPYKQRAYKRLCKSKLYEKFNALTMFPGVLDGLELGSIARIFSTHAFEEITQHLDHIFKVWDRITLGDKTVREAADAETVKFLELRAPSVSLEDRHYIQRLMQSGMLFKRIANPDLRRRIQSSILETTTVIPSIRTFHKNMKYFSIAINIIKTYIIGQVRTDQSIYKAMSALWRRNSPAKCFLERKEDEFYELHCQLTPKLAYQQLVIAALRLFSPLAQIPPRCESGERRMAADHDSSCLASFLRKSQRWGFNSPKVEQTLSTLNAARPISLNNIADLTDPEESQLKRRCGIPFSTSYKYIRRKLFLPQLLAEQGLTAHPTTLFIQKDFIQSILGEIKVISEDVHIIQASETRTIALEPHQFQGSSTPPQLHTYPDKNSTQDDGNVSPSGPGKSPLNSPSTESILSLYLNTPKYYTKIDNQREVEASNQTQESTSIRSLIRPDLNSQTTVRLSNLDGERDIESVPSLSSSIQSSARSLDFREWISKQDFTLSRFVRHKAFHVEDEDKDTESYRSIILPENFESRT